MKMQSAFAYSRLLTQILILFLLLTSNSHAGNVAVGIGVGVGAPYYAPAPVYYGPPPGYYYAGPEPYAEPYVDEEVTTTEVEWVPAHLEDGVWMPGRYVQYVTTAPGPDYIWVEGHWDNYHRWHRGHWRRHYYH
jgi:hypothetical protein